MDSRSQFLGAIEDMLAAGERLSIHAVARRCGVSHSLIYNRYPDIKERIKELQQSQSIAKKAAEDQELISKLLARNKALKRRSQTKSDEERKEAFKALLVHVQQLYSMYDELREDRNRLADQLSGRDD
jgi:AcrR family transcriptional regulator